MKTGRRQEEKRRGEGAEDKNLMDRGRGRGQGKRDLYSTCLSRPQCQLGPTSIRSHIRSLSSQIVAQFSTPPQEDNTDEGDDSDTSVVRCKSKRKRGVTGNQPGSNKARRGQLSKRIVTSSDDESDDAGGSLPVEHESDVDADFITDMLVDPHTNTQEINNHLTVVAESSSLSEVKPT
ncbi:hypothetical protein BGZ61DRAFT_474471 [Ilyonectria robusta]|uniref:uncharacterized protein n=1 Tax=Ilyonectria robusta TaxID=1079257 RepID=UPI001E8D361C|nr:uncharacterized protein BGZ61DRAFT_474471 [Ilyonectria robusta]KAH8733830.1 hypothetical protein BGZ61DRAFT_474471 [Ilyonectria robusta]